MRKAYELNTYDLSMAAAYGYALIFSGNYATARRSCARAVEASSAHPSWWDYGLFLGQFMLGDMQAAARAGEPLATIKRSHYIAARSSWPTPRAGSQPSPGSCTSSPRNFPNSPPIRRRP